MPTESNKATGPRTIKASEFRAKCLKLMDEVAESGEEIVITKNGRPVSRLLPYREKPQSPFGRDRHILPQFSHRQNRPRQFIPADDRSAETMVITML